MTWFDDLRRVDFGGKKMIGASFRGVSFFVEESQRSGGRRVVVHEFPMRDKPFAEDMGKRAGKLPVTGYVIGDNYLVQRDALVSALEDVPGPGTLIHPYYGQLTAICDTYTVTEKVPEGGMATFSIAFAEAPAQTPVPTIEVDTASQVATSADAAHTAVAAQLAADYDASGLPSFALASAASAIQTASAGVTRALAPIVRDTQELASLSSQLSLITAQASSLARQPATLLTQARTAIAALVTTAASAPGDLMSSLVAAYSAALAPPVIGTTAARQREALNLAALIGAIRRVLAIEAARLAPVVPYVSIDDAIAARDQIAGLLDDQAQTAGDAAYPALVDLRSQVLRAVPGGQAFARVITITRRVAVPSLVLAYELYGSVDREQDIIARNKIRDPAIISGELQVLSDGE